jgi:hypothetical protein
LKLNGGGLKTFHPSLSVEERSPPCTLIQLVRILGRTIRRKMKSKMARLEIKKENYLFVNNILLDIEILRKQ